MNHIKILSFILKQTNTLIRSEEYKESYIIGNSFSRNRKLSFSNAVYFICSALRKSLSSEIHNFIGENSYLEFPDISKQAFSKARQNISSEAFKELCRLFFVIRLSSSYKEIQAINSNDTVLNYNFGTTSKKVRVIKIELPDGTIEMLATNIFDSNITTTLFIDST